MTRHKMRIFEKKFIDTIFQATQLKCNASKLDYN